MKPKTGDNTSEKTQSDFFTRQEEFNEDFVYEVVKYIQDESLQIIKEIEIKKSLVISHNTYLLKAICMVLHLIFFFIPDTKSIAINHE